MSYIGLGIAQNEFEMKTREENDPTRSTRSKYTAVYYPCIKGSIPQWDTRSWYTAVYLNRVSGFSSYCDTRLAYTAVDASQWGTRP